MEKLKVPQEKKRSFFLILSPKNQPCWRRLLIEPLLHYNFCNKLSHSENYCKLKKNKQQLEQHAKLIDDNIDGEHLFMVS